MSYNTNRFLPNEDGTYCISNKSLGSFLVSSCAQAIKKFIDVDVKRTSAENLAWLTYKAREARKSLDLDKVAIDLFNGMDMDAVSFKYFMPIEAVSELKNHGIRSKYKILKNMYYSVSEIKRALKKEGIKITRSNTHLLRKLVPVKILYESKRGGKHIVIKGVDALKNIEFFISPQHEFASSEYIGTKQVIQEVGDPICRMIKKKKEYINIPIRMKKSKSGKQYNRADITKVKRQLSLLVPLKSIDFYTKLDQWGRAKLLGKANVKVIGRAYILKEDAEKLELFFRQKTEQQAAQQQSTNKAKEQK